MHFAAVQDSQEANDVGGGAFTISLLEMIEDFAEEGYPQMSVEDSDPIEWKFTTKMMYRCSSIGEIITIY